MDPDVPVVPAPQPSIFRWILGFLLVGACWGLTTPFMRRAAINYVPPSRPSLTDPNNSWLKRKVLGIFYAVIGVLSRPAYAIPLLLNVTGSVWFFILIGQAELSLTVPITNSLAFLFTVLGEWWAEKKVISRDTWIGMALVLGGIGLCVQSKTS
ncbi:integral membrane protein [Sporormia fimetaria CBS 119925]|uniref:Integral membrane protein n=1 Tax=Sporormia fimetaria CBS 119925 TaxID=1340428 RepID=A0A6A6VBN8_9PLEO|nr:integral membrane protein [Sporormia fimetaria CBS 119925]